MQAPYIIIDVSQKDTKFKTNPSHEHFSSVSPFQSIKHDIEMELGQIITMLMGYGQLGQDQLAKPVNRTTSGKNYSVP